MRQERDHEYHAVALIGAGSIASIVVRRLLQSQSNVHLVGVLDRDAARTRERLGQEVHVATSVGELLSWEPTLVIECAGHTAVARYGAEVLKSGIDLIVASAGALAERRIEDELRNAARVGNSHLRIPSGAIGGLDALASARLAGLEYVGYTGRKPTSAWRGTRAEQIANLASISSATVIFDGAAREAALAYPKNANVTAAVALAGLGFDDTRTILFADPNVDANIHQLEARGAFGILNLTVTNKPLAENPKTSTLAAYSILRCAIEPSESIVV